MTLQDCIDEISTIEPSGYDESQMARWVLQAEKSVATGIYLLENNDATLTDPNMLYGYDFPLLAPPPFDRIYPAYLHAMIHYANSEYERYQNDMQLYNEQFGEFARWFAGKYEPAVTKRVEEVRIYGIGAEDSPVLPLPPDCVIGRAEAVWIGYRYVGDHMYISYWEPDFGSANPGITFIDSVEAFSNSQGGIALRTGRGARLDGYFTAPTDCYVRFNLYHYGWPDKFGRRP